MNVQYLSDLHLEFPENREYIRNNPIIPSADILIIAGDLGHLNLFRKHHIYKEYCDSFLDYCSKNWKRVIIIPGNHEYYGGTTAVMTQVPRQYDIADNITFINNYSLFLDEYNVMIFGATLWANIPYENQMSVYFGMNDYNFINYRRGEKLSIKNSIDEHIRTLTCIEGLPAKETRNYKLIIATHHGCHIKCLNSNYNNPRTNSAYTTDLRGIIEQIKPEAWIVGHTHFSQVFKYDETIIAENSLGYVSYGNEKNFLRNAIIDI